MPACWCRPAVTARCSGGAEGRAAVLGCGLGRFARSFSRLNVRAFGCWRRAAGTGSAAHRIEARSGGSEQKTQCLSAVVLLDCRCVGAERSSVITELFPVTLVLTLCLLLQAAFPRLGCTVCVMRAAAFPRTRFAKFALLPSKHLPCLLLTQC